MYSQLHLSITSQKQNTFMQKNRSPIPVDSGFPLQISVTIRFYLFPFFPPMYLRTNTTPPTSAPTPSTIFAAWV